MPCSVAMIEMRPASRHKSCKLCCWNQPANPVLDVRTRPSEERHAAQIPGNIRVLPDQVTE